MTTIAIIGAGFSGTTLALQLLKLARQETLRVLLISDAPRPGPGLAYRASDPQHTLNAAAETMSPFPDDLNDFARFLQSGGHSIAARFAPRQLYGDYLAQRLAEVASHPAFTSVIGEVIDLIRMTDGFEIILRRGQRLNADVVVLACGHAGPRHPPGLARGQAEIGSRYVADPWHPAACATIGPDSPVVLLGSGLTAVDTALTLLRQNPQRPITMLSRHGRLPMEQSSITCSDVPTVDLSAGHSPRRLLRALRQQLPSVADDLAWPRLASAIRPHAQALWRGWPPRERRQFLRHLQARWDSVRHRMPREAHAVISAAMTRNTLQLRAGQVHAVNATENCIMVHFRARDSGLTDTLQAARLINCTGPDTRLHHLDRRLIGRLARRGTLRNDPCTLGIDTSDSLQPLDRHGHCTPGLYYLGPLLRAGYGEATAVPELRQFALQLAQHLTAPVRTLT